MNQTFTDEGFRTAVAIVISKHITDCLKGVYPEKANNHLVRLSFLLNQIPDLVDDEIHFYREYIEQLEDDSDNENDNK